MKTFLIGRISKEDKKNDESNGATDAFASSFGSVSIPAQLHRLKNYVEQHEYLDLYETFEFEESAWRSERREFSKVVKSVKKHTKRHKETVALCCDKVDRLVRNFNRDMVDLDDLMKSGLLELHFPSDHLVINKSSPAVVKHQYYTAINTARYYSDAISDNTKRALEQKRREGQWTGPAPFGYKNVSDEKGWRKDIVKDELRASVVIEIFKKYASGDHSIRAISKDLCARGITTAKGKPVYPSVVEHILKNPFYHGEMRTIAGIFPHRHEALISKDLFVQVQQMANKKNNHPSKTNKSRRFVFSGILSCSYCGCSVTPELKKGRYVYYSCTNTKGICIRQYIREEKLLDPVYDVLKSISFTDAEIVDFSDYLKKHYNTQLDDRVDDLKKYNRQLNDEQEKLDKLLDLLIEGKIVQEAYDRKHEIITTSIGAIKSAINKLTREPKADISNAIAALKIAQNSEDLLSGSEIDRKHQIVKKLFQNCQLNGKNPEFTTTKAIQDLVSASLCPTGLREPDTLRTLDWVAIREELERIFVKEDH